MLRYKEIEQEELLLVVVVLAREVLWSMSLHLWPTTGT